MSRCERHLGGDTKKDTSPSAEARKLAPGHRHPDTNCDSTRSPTRFRGMTTPSAVFRCDPGLPMRWRRPDRPGRGGDARQALRGAHVRRNSVPKAAAEWELEVLGQGQRRCRGPDPTLHRPRPTDRRPDQANGTAAAQAPTSHGTGTRAATPRRLAGGGGVSAGSGEFARGLGSGPADGLTEGQRAGRPARALTKTRER